MTREGGRLDASGVRSDYTTGVSNQFRLDDCEKPARVVERLLGRRWPVFFRQFLRFGWGKGLTVDGPIVRQKGLLRSFDGLRERRSVEIRIQDQKKLITVCSKRHRDHQTEEKYYSAVEFAVSYLSRTSIQHHDILSRRRSG